MLPQNSRLNKLTKKQHFWTHASTRAKGLKNENILDLCSHLKPTETFQYTHYSYCHPPGVSKRITKDEALRLLRTNSSKMTFEENIRNFRVRSRVRGYPRHLVDHILSEVKFTERESASKYRQKTQDKPLPFVSQCHPSVPHLKRIFMENSIGWRSNPYSGKIYKELPSISYRKGEILKRYTCGSKTLRVKVEHNHEKCELCSVCQHSFNLSMFFFVIDVKSSWRWPKIKLAWPQQGPVYRESR